MLLYLNDKRVSKKSEIYAKGNRRLIYYELIFLASGSQRVNKQIELAYL